MTDSSAPIGVFDSGVGGLSVLKEICLRLPHENLVYLADSAFAPYGEKSREAIIERSHWCTDWLLSQGAKAVVVACNTATAAAVHQLRADYTVPIIAMEPAVKPAAAMSRSGVIGVMATTGTLSSEKFAALRQQHSAAVEVITQPCPGLVEEIEKGEPDSPQLMKLLQHYVEQLVQRGADVIVLGCTHYPLIREQIESLIASDVHVIDSGAAVAQRVEAQLIEHELLSVRRDDAKALAWSSGNIKVLEHAWQRWMSPLPCYDFRKLSTGECE